MITILVSLASIIMGYYFILSALPFPVYHVHGSLTLAMLIISSVDLCVHVLVCDPALFFDILHNSLNCAVLKFYPGVCFVNCFGVE